MDMVQKNYAQLINNKAFRNSKKTDNIETCISVMIVNNLHKNNCGTLKQQ